MIGSYKVLPLRFGLFRRRIFATELWLLISHEEKLAIRETNLDITLLHIKEDFRDDERLVNLSHFLRRSGPRYVRFRNSYDAQAAGLDFYSKVQKASEMIIAYQQGHIINEQVFRC